jgi:hypothetical protein
VQKPPPDYRLEFVLHPEADGEYRHFEQSDRSPFEARHASVPRVNAWWLAEAALASYWNPTFDAPRFIAPDGIISDREPSILHFFPELFGAPRQLLPVIESLTDFPDFFA